MKRHELINEIIKRSGFTKYLEIGVDNPDLCFNLVECEKKIGLDPYDDKLGTHQWNSKNVESFKENVQGEFYEMTSDEFFAKKRNKFNLIFIDGLHQEPQVDKDIENSLKRLHPGGIIMMHDTIPKSRESQVRNPEPGIPWVGDCYRSFWKLRMTRKDLSLVTVDIDTGFSFISKGSNALYAAPNFQGNMSYVYWKLHKNKIMNVVSLETFLNNWCASEQL